MLSAGHFFINSNASQEPIQAVAMWKIYVQGHSYTTPFNACSTGPSTVGWKRGVKLLVLLSRKSISWLQHTLKQQHKYKSQSTMAKLHHTVKYRCRHDRAWTGLFILHISTGTFSHNCKVLSGGDLPPSLKSAFVLCTHYGKCTLTYTLQNNRTGISSNMKTVHALPLQYVALDYLPNF